MLNYACDITTPIIITIIDSVVSGKALCTGAAALAKMFFVFQAILPPFLCVVCVHVAVADEHPSKQI